MRWQLLLPAHRSRLLANRPQHQYTPLNTGIIIQRRLVVIATFRSGSTTVVQMLRGLPSMCVAPAWRKRCSVVYAFVAALVATAVGTHVCWDDQGLTMGFSDDIGNGRAEINGLAWACSTVDAHPTILDLYVCTRFKDTVWCGPLPAFRVMA